MSVPFHSEHTDATNGHGHYGLVSYTALLLLHGPAMGWVATMVLGKPPFIVRLCFFYFAIFSALRFSLCGAVKGVSIKLF